MTTGISRRAALSLSVAGAAALGLPSARAGTAAAPFRRGVNTWPWFSLTREYPAPRTDYAWPPYQENRPVPRTSDLAGLAAAGVDFIRIPVDPGPFLAATADKRAVLMGSLLQAVAQARAAGLGVVVNIQPNDATHYWHSRNMLASPQAPLFGLYRGLVAEVAGALGGLGERDIALEPVNEPPQDCGAAAWNETQVALLSAARSRAPDLTLVATGGCGSMIRGLVALDPAPLSMFEPLLFTFHFYEPYLFSHQGAPWMREPVYRALNDVPWPGAAGSLAETLAAVRARMALDTEISDAAKREAYAVTERLMRQYFEADPDHRFIEHYLDFVGAWARRHAIPAHRVLMGEFGAVKTTGRIAASRPADRARYIRDVREAAEARGFPWAFWNLFDSMGVMDDATRAFDPPVLAALGLTMPG